MIELFLPAPTFTWREKRKTRTARHPIGKGNREKIQTAGKRCPKCRRGEKMWIAPIDRVVAAQAALARALFDHPLRPPEPLGTVVLDCTFVFEPTASWPEWRKAQALENVERPEGSNIADRDQLHKMLADALEDAEWIDNDRTIVEGDVSKVFGPEAGFRLRLRPLPPAPKTLAEAQGATQGRLF